MTTEARIKANRKNATRSTGPRTPKGKRRASRNATTHGLLAQDVLLEDENEQLFGERRDAILADLNPSGELEQVLAERIIVCEWRLRRDTLKPACFSTRSSITRCTKRKAWPKGARDLTTVTRP